MATVAAGKDFPVAILNHNEPIFYCVPAKAYEALMDKLEDAELNALADACLKDGKYPVDELLAYLRDTRDYVENYLAAHLPKIRLIKPEGTYLLWLDCRELRMGDAQLKHFFVHKAGVGLSPGILFGESGSGFMRMNIAAPRHVIVAALESIRKVIRS